MSPVSGAAGATPLARAGRIAALLLALLGPLAAASRTEASAPYWRPGQPGGTLEVALVTVAPGEVYWQRFGHNAILLRDSASGEAVLYHYGVFDFAEDDFLANFLRGRMRYAMTGVDPATEFAAYRAEGRALRLQWLALAPPQRDKLRRFLEWNRAPDNARYSYDYFTANCSTKVRDALDAALAGAIARATASRSRGFTYRQHALRLTAPDLPLHLGIHAGLGPFADQRLSFWQEMFVPMELARHLAEVSVTDDGGAVVPLITREEVLPGSLPAPPADAPAWFWRYLGIGLALALALSLLSGRRTAAARRALGLLLGTLWLVAGLGGLVLLGLWLFTAHVAAHANQNLALFNPLALALLPAALTLLSAHGVPSRGAVRLAAALAVIAALAWFALVLPWFRQANLDWIGLWLPLHVAAALALGRSRASD